MAISLSTTSSIVDFLNLQGKESSYTARQKLYGDLGLNKTLGDYAGSANQNTNLLNALRSQTTTVPSSTPSPYGMSTPSGPVYYNVPGETAPTTPAASAVQYASQPVKPNLTPEMIQAYRSAISTGAFSPTQALAEIQKLSSTYTLPKDLQQRLYAPGLEIKTPQGLADFQAGGTGDIYYKSTNPQVSKTDVTGTATPAYDALSFLNKPPSAADVATSVAEDPAYKLYQESLANKGLAETASAEAQKQKLQVQYEADKTKLEQNLAERGLAFSGIRTQDVQALTNSLASSTLAVDRELASTLFASDTSLKSKFLDLATSVVERAATAQGKKREEALGQLNKLGFALNPLTNEIMAIPDKSADPVSFKEWSLAGGELGTGQTYAQWIEKSKSLTTAQLQTALDRVSDDFRQDPVVKQYTTAGAGWSFIDSIKTNTTNPADDIGMIYAFAKIMDPESVVREGEYATVQRYAQSWADTFGFTAQRIFENTKFLSSEAISNMKATAGAKFNSISQAYNSARGTYEQRIENLRNGIISGNLPYYDFNVEEQTGQTGQTGQIDLSDLDFSFQ